MLKAWPSRIHGDPDTRCAATLCCGSALENHGGTADVCHRNLRFGGAAECGGAADDRDRGGAAGCGGGAVESDERSGAVGASVARARAECGGAADDRVQRRGRLRRRGRRLRP